MSAEVPLPPLPEAIAADEPGDFEGEMPAPAAPQAVAGGGRGLLPGGWRLRLDAAGGGEPLVGPLRVTRDADGRVRASGDLYAAADGAAAGAGDEGGIPVHPRRLHREYLRVTGFSPVRDGGFEARVETYRIGEERRWQEARRLRARLWPSPVAAAEEDAAPSAGDGPDERPPGAAARPAGPGGEAGAPRRWSGDAVDEAGAPAGRLALDWAAPWLRRAVVEIDREAGATVPRGDGGGRGWQDVFAEVGWEVTVVEDDHAVPPPAAGAWTDAEVHAAMLAWRRHDDLDGEWRFHVLCVRRLASTERGLMYDAFASDSNNVPREGLALAADWVFPDAEPWGRVRGRRFGDEPRTYFRTAVHELGHAMGLLHNPAGDAFMSTTTAIARRAPDGTFPDNVRWAFADDDALRLAHLPDPCVRPGGLPFVTDATADAESGAPAAGPPVGLDFAVAPVAAAFPLAAPVRVEVALAHRGGGEPALVPGRLSLKGGHVRGRAIGPDGVARRFLPLVRCSDDDELAPLAPGETRRHGLALLRGPDGALFPAPGAYRVEVDLAWAADGRELRLAAATAVAVEPPPDAASARVAGELLATPDLLLSVALGGDHLPAGSRALADALADPVLRPHYAAIEARRLARRGAPGDRRRAAALCREGAVTAASERFKLNALVAGGPLRRLARRLVEPFFAKGR